MALNKNGKFEIPTAAEILAAMRNDADKEEKKLIQRAYGFAQAAHEGSTRASGAPYFQHVASTALNLAEFGLDATTIAAGLLHDVIEDACADPQEVKKEFGAEVYFLVDGVTKLGVVKYSGMERHAKSMQKFLLASIHDWRVLVIKIADRLHNVRTLEFLPEKKAHRIAEETIEIYAPLAYRMGMGRLVGELQEASFPFAYPKEYQEIGEKLKKHVKNTDKYLEKAWKKLKSAMARADLGHAVTQKRVKKLYSLWKKMQKKKVGIESIYDIIALRVIVETREECYSVLRIVHEIWKPIPGRIRDYIALPKTNGYQSIHTTVLTGDGGLVEVQIRTRMMHEYAEYGLAAHSDYKKSKTASENTEWLHEIQELEKHDLDTASFLKSLSADTFSDRIFVFTPTGDVIDLPIGATVLDFAYAVHTDIGNHAFGGFVNGKFSALKDELKNADIVDVKHDKNKYNPSSKWLNWVRTHIAKREISAYLKKNKKTLWEHIKMRSLF